MTLVKINSEADAKRAVDELHRITGSKIVVLTSYSTADDPSSLYLLGSSKTKGQEESFIIKFDRLEGYFTGTGDLFAALLLAHYQFHCEKATQSPLMRACEAVTAIMQKILSETANYSKSTAQPTEASRSLSNELRLIECREMFTRSAEIPKDLLIYSAKSI